MIAQMKGYEAFAWLTAFTFAKRDFAQLLTEEGLDVALKECPYNDLTDEQRKFFEAAAGNENLRVAVENVWSVYDEERVNGNLPSPASQEGYWLP